MQTVSKLVRKLPEELLCKNAATVKGGNVSFWGSADILILSITSHQTPHMPFSYSRYVKDWDSNTRYKLKIIDDWEGLRYFWKFIEWMEGKRQERGEGEGQKQRKQLTPFPQNLLHVWVCWLRCQSEHSPPSRHWTGQGKQRDGGHELSTWKPPKGFMPCTPLTGSSTR